MLPQHAVGVSVCVPYEVPIRPTSRLGGVRFCRRSNREMLGTKLAEGQPATVCLRSMRSRSGFGGRRGAREGFGRRRRGSGLPWWPQGPRLTAVRLTPSALIPS